MRTLHGCFISLVFLLLAPAVRADAWSTLRAPRAVDAGWQDWPMPGGDYDRYAYPVIGADFAVWVDQWHLPNAGDSWQIRLAHESQAEPDVVYELVYDAATDCLVDMFGALECDVVERAEAGLVVYADYLVYYGTQCMAEGGWTMTGTYNGSVIGPSPHPVIPVDFRPGVPDVILDTTRTNPRIPESEDRDPAGRPFARSYDPGLPAGRIVADLVVRDDLDCGWQLDDELIEVRARIVPGSGSHRHFDEADLAGTGTLQADGELVEQPDPATLRFRMAGETARVVYTAGDYGVKEELAFQAIEATSPAAFMQEIEITTVAATGEMAQLSENGDWYKVAGGGVSTCDRAHNESATVRNSDYMLPFARNMAAALAYDFRDRTGLMLSFNDASLEMGGFFDWGTSNRNAKCHGTHRIGVDVDLNGSPVNPGACLEGTGPRLETCEIISQPYGDAANALQYLDSLAERWYHAHYWRQHDREVSPLKLHYRFPR